VSVKRRARIALGLTPRCWASKRIVSEPIPPGVATAMANTTRSPAERTRLLRLSLCSVDISLPTNRFVHCTVEFVLSAVSDRAQISLTGRTCTVCLSLGLPGT
jgi:hypothetical protein